MQRVEATKRLASVLLTNSDTTIYTAPMNRRVIVNSILLFNNHSSNIVCSLWLVPNGSSTNTTNKFFEKSLYNKQTASIQQLPIVLEPGDSLVGLGSTTSQVSAKVFGSVVIED